MGAWCEMKSWFLSLASELRKMFLSQRIYKREPERREGVNDVLENVKWPLSSFQLLSGVWLFTTPWTTARQASLSIANFGVHPNPCPLSQWCHPAISSSVVPFSSCLQSFPASGSFQMSQLFASGAQSIGVSASTSVLPMNTQDWSPLGWTGWISLQSKGLSKSLLQQHSSKASSLWNSAYFIVQLALFNTSQIYIIRVLSQALL